jgi:hypothetical protein
MKSLGIGFGIIFFIWFLSMVISISFSEPSHAADQPKGFVTPGGSYAWAYDEEEHKIFFCVVPLDKGTDSISCIVYPNAVKHLSEYDEFIYEEPIF